MGPLAPRRPPNLRLLKRRALRGVGVALAVALPVLALRGTRPMQVAEAKSFDLRAQWTADASAAHPDIAIVAIDDNSLDVYRETLGRWPWPRYVQGMLLEYLHAAGARLVVFDVLFPEADRADPQSDADFAAAIRASGRVVLPLAFTAGAADEAAAWERLRAAEQEGRADAGRVAEGFAIPAAPGPAPAVPDFAYLEAPHPDFARGAAALGSVRTTPDPDGVVRREHPAATHGGRLYPSLALAAARRLEPDRFGGPVAVTAGELRTGSERVPLADGRMVLRWRGPFMADGRTTYPVYPAFHVLNSLEQVATGAEPTVPLAAFEGKTVFVALTGMGLLDARATPLRPHDPGVMVHATQLDNLLRGDAIRRAPPAAGAAALLALALAVGLAAALAGAALPAAAAAALLVGGYAAAAVWAYAAGVWVELAAPVLAGAAVFAGSMAAGYVAEGREKRRVRELFGRYVSPEYVRRLADDPDGVTLGGERVPLTILFSDIRGFTSLSERLPPERVIEVLNEYLEAMAGVVFRHGGTLDKFIGDAVMAFWGAPVAVDDHARRAVEAAVDMERELAALNARWEARGAGVRLEIGVGVHTGEAIVGNVGSLTRKLDYTAIGDAVNVASRLEGLNKTYGTTILVSGATRAAAGEDGYDCREIGETRVKGKEDTVRIYEVRGRRASARGPAAAAAAPAVALLLAAALAPAAAAQPGQWSASVYQPGAWRGAEVVPFATANPGTDTLALVARVELFARPPVWRAEVQRVAEGDRLEEPLVLVSTDGQVRVVTAVGATPLARHAAADDPLVRAVVRQFDDEGRLRSPDAARRVERTADGRVEWVVVRRAAARPQVTDALFETRRGALIGRQVGRLGVRAAGGERRQEVVQTAAARGVVRVQTPDGEIAVDPDTAAVRRMVALAVSPVELDRFMREAGVGPYAAREDEPAVEVVP